ncbi:Ger(x)C family spore germination protein [Pseudobacteroides cellulosolvens]|uniref:Germination protein, Ger(X)C family n=1 Tax=Pseudobacteroides cellulosolvens ATCC 35603 = DSM 2933 TaxID=398512 RepID=A0A0L6JSK7_9FIRM|nr:Ger(x)C family spore germination protein [Pseudobacteroides cellulosolvens]KNY28821.1 germination protein, Ger(x)C family [Pseudobacteroides cellulosolvens ATCC 35603 = DSM 2933]
MKLKRAVSVIIILVSLCSLMTGCFDKKEVDELGYVIALGLDKGKTNYLKLTFQIAKPHAGGESGGGGGGGGGEPPYSNITVEAPSIYAGINMANTFTSKQINLSHNKVVVFSEELAREGLEAYLHALLRGREFRPSMYMVVSRNSAEEYLKGVKPELVLNPSKYYELAFQSYSYTGLIPNSQFHDFYKYSESLYKDPVAILGGIGSFKSSDDFSVEKSTFRERGHKVPIGGDFFAGTVTKTGGVDTENMGLAVFNGDKMVGEMDGTDSKYLLLATGEYGHAYWTIPDQKEEGKFVLLDIKQSRRPQHKVKLVDEKPYIDVKIILEADILSIQSTVDYEQGELTNLLEKYVEELIGKEMHRFLEKTSKDFNSDICGFGSYAKKYFLTWKEWEKYNWKSKYKDATFNVDINLKIRRPGLILKTLPSVGSEGTEENDK